MSTGRRFYDLARAHVNSEWDRLKDLDIFDKINDGLHRSDAQAELNASTQPGAEAGSVAFERIEYQVEKRVVTDPEEKRQIARSVLGVGAEAQYEEIREAFERLSRRANPSNFPENTSERKHAQELHRRVHLAYQTLTENMDSTERRFKNLELD
ncbi:MAG: hypothetical protein K8H99_04830 [Nitrospirae bacterium]|nr:hypothetical protein [Fimbriimonadaceae bacterium]